MVQPAGTVDEPLEMEFVQVASLLAINVPVEATPKVVAIPIAAVGPIAATATPALTPAAPAPAFFTAAFVFS